MTRPPKAKKNRPDVPCKNCGRMMSPGRNGKRDYCNNACKQAAWRKRKDQLVTIANGESNTEG